MTEQLSLALDLVTEICLAQLNVPDLTKPLVDA